MKIAKSNLFIGKEYRTLHLSMRELKAKVRKGIQDGGLYFLEKIFGECNGHGAGVGGEDISFGIKIKKKNYIIDINLDGEKIEISERIELYTQNREYFDSKVADEIDHALVAFITKKLVA